uniref:RNA-binding Musashi-1-like protein n=1 Tax=Aegilops tauschii TaxID=37682 RepID=R7W0U7_AEGTA
MQRKIFVGNVHADVDVNRLYEYFSQFGEIEEGPLGFDKSTGKPKGFALFVYKSVDSARRALEEPMRNFDGKMLNVQKAIDGRTKGSSGSNSNANNANATAASTQMTVPSIAAINPYDPSAYGATAVHDMGFAQQAALLGMAGLQGAAAYQGGPPGFQGTPGFPTSAGFQVGQAASQTGTTAAATGAAGGYQAGAAGQGQVSNTQIGGTGFQGGY